MKYGILHKFGGEWALFGLYRSRNTMLVAFNSLCLRNPTPNKYKSFVIYA